MPGHAYLFHYPDCDGVYESYGVRCSEFSRNSGTCRSCRQYFLKCFRKSDGFTRPEHFIILYGVRLKLEDRHIDDALILLKRIRKHDPTAICRSPLSVAGGLLYIVCLKNRMMRTQTEVAEACQISEGTVRISSKDFLAVLRAMRK